ncbi:hypothetical protein TcWFU_005795 [Taenia crassiceps]|uniref:GPS domain-containing protein n=1 Tax=Taenia crassiceps TaxID=6207 RepID=A0ABR4Q0K5_9CEST
MTDGMASQHGHFNGLIEESTLGQKSSQKIRETPFGFTYDIECPDPVTVNQTFQCNLTVLDENRVRAVPKRQGRPPSSHETAEVNLLSLGIASLRRPAGESIGCSLPEMFAYGPMAFESRHLRSISIAADGVETKFTHHFPYCSGVMAVDDGSKDASNAEPAIHDKRLAWTTVCQACDIQTRNINSPCNFFKDDEIRLEPAQKLTCVKAGEIHSQPSNHSVPVLPDKTEIAVCLILVQPITGFTRSCRELEVQLATTCDDCSLEAPNFIHAFQSVCVICNCPPMEGNFEFYAKTPKNQLTFSVSANPSFCGIVPLIEGDFQMCIRSLRNSSLYIDKCFRAIKFIWSSSDELEKQIDDISSGKNDILEQAIASKDPNTISGVVQAICAQIRAFLKTCLPQNTPDAIDLKREIIAKLIKKLVGALEFVNHNHLLPLSSGLEAISTLAEEITFTTMNRIQSKLVEAAYVLPQLLRNSLFEDIFDLAYRFTNICVYLIEGMRYQYEKPTPSLRNVQPQQLDYETDIDANPVDSIDTLISEHIRRAQRQTANSLIRVMARIDSVLAGSFHEVLVPGGSMFHANYSRGGFVRFCRVMTWNLHNNRDLCGERNIVIPNIKDLQDHVDVVARTSHFADNIYPFFNHGQHNPQSNIISLAFYVEGRKLNLSHTQPPFRFTLTKNTSVSSTASSDVDFGEQEVQLPAPIVAVDGTLVHQLLIMHRFEVVQEETTFVFKLHPTETTTCPQYLVVARFTTPPNLQAVDNYGSFYWAMLPASTSACKKASNAGERQQLYSLHIPPNDLARLKAEATARTRGMKMRTEELNLFYIGFRQVSATELNHYDERTPPPVPYPFRDQINTTAYVSASMPSCVYITPDEDAWHTGGCDVVPSPNSDEILCECTHLTIFAADITPIVDFTQFKYILQWEHSVPFFISAHLVTIAVASPLLLKLINSLHRAQFIQICTFRLDIPLLSFLPSVLPPTILLLLLLPLLLKPYLANFSSPSLTNEKSARFRHHFALDPTQLTNLFNQAVEVAMLRSHSISHADEIQCLGMGDNESYSNTMSVACT